MSQTLRLTPNEHVRVRRADPSALEVEVEWTKGDGAIPPRHLHPAQDERFEVLEGVVSARIDGVEKRLLPGDTLDIPAGAVHQMWNAGDEPARAIWETRPAGRTLEWFEALDRAPDAGLRTMAPLLSEYRDVFRLAVKPRVLGRLALVLLAALAMALPATAPAATTKVKQARFVAYIAGKQVTEWKVPRYPVGSNCQGQRYMEAGGSEVIRWETKPFRLLAYQYPGRPEPALRFGTWDLYSQVDGFSRKATGSLTRTGAIKYSLDPGQCHDSGDPTSGDTGPYDCRRLPYTGYTSFHWRGGRMMVTQSGSAKGDDGQATSFDNCPIEGPSEPLEGQWTDIDQEFDPRDLMNPALGLHEVLGRKQWTEKIHRDYGTATTTTTFKVRLRRAR